MSPSNTELFQYFSREVLPYSSLWRYEHIVIHFQLELGRLQTSFPRLGKSWGAGQSITESTRWGPSKRNGLSSDPSQVNNQKQFVVVCGNINYGSITNFLYDFYHPAREDVNCEVCRSDLPNNWSMAFPHVTGDHTEQEWAWPRVWGAPEKRKDSREVFSGKF